MPDIDLKQLTTSQSISLAAVPPGCVAVWVELSADGKPVWMAKQADGTIAPVGGSSSGGGSPSGGGTGGASVAAARKQAIIWGN